jgi:hypothetical protein
MNDTVCAACSHSFQEGEEPIPVTSKVAVGGIVGAALPQYIEREHETVHADCFDHLKHNYAAA